MTEPLEAPKFKVGDRVAVLIARNGDKTMTTSGVVVNLDKAQDAILSHCYTVRLDVQQMSYVYVEDQLTLTESSGTTVSEEPKQG